MKLETFVNLDHVKFVRFNQNDDDGCISCDIYFSDDDHTYLENNSAMKFYTLLVKKGSSGKMNFVIIDGNSI